MLWALALIAVATSALIVATLVMRLDRDAAIHDLTTARGAVSSAVHAQAQSAYNTARWDDGVRHLYGGFDERWARANISGDYIAYVIDARGNTLFSRRADGTIDPPLAAAAPEAVRAILSHLPRTLAEARELKNGYAFFARFRGHASLFGAMPVIPLQGKYSPPADDLRYLVYVDPLTQARLDQLGARFGLADLRLATRTADGSSLPLSGPAGRVATLRWAAEHPGTAGLAAIMPILLLAATAVLALTFALQRLMRRQEQRLAAQAVEYRRVALEAKAACEQAEEARRQAEQARGEADALRGMAEAAARAEAMERQRSAEALKAAARSTGQDLQTYLSELVSDLVQLASRLDKSADATWAAMTRQESHAGWAGRKSASAATSLDEVLGAAAELTRAVQSIRQEVASTREAVASAARHSSSTAADSSELLAHVGGIGCASDAISKVARQTRQLAVNAAIVAAHGQSTHDGFSVIAREIKTLSENSRQSTSEISQRLQAVSGAVHHSVQASMSIDAELQHIHASISKTDAAVRAHETASEEIRTSVHQARDEAHAVGKLVEEVALSIAEVQRSVQMTRDVSAHVRSRVSLLERALGKAIADLLAA